MAIAEQLLKELKHVLYESPYDGYWTDSMLLGYMAEGQDRFCEDTGYFIDPVSYTVITEADTQHYAISDRIIRVLNAYEGPRELRRFEEQDSADFRDPSLIEFQDPNGDPRPWAFQTDFNPGYLSLWPTPKSIRTIALRVWRYPLKSLCESGLRTVVELPGPFQRAIIEYAAFKALNHHDQELQDTLKANDHFAAYQYYVDRGEESFRRKRGSEVRVGPSRAYVV